MWSSRNSILIDIKAIIIIRRNKNKRKEKKTGRRIKSRKIRKAQSTISITREICSYKSQIGMTMHRISASLRRTKIMIITILFMIKISLNSPPRLAKVPKSTKFLYFQPPPSENRTGKSKSKKTKTNRKRKKKKNRRVKGSNN